MDIKRSATMLVAAVGLCSMQAFAANSTNTKYIYMMVPPDFTDWMTSVPMISMDGGKTGAAMTADTDKCGWFYYAFKNESATDNVFFYRDDDAARDDMIGMNGNWETNASPTAIPLKTLFDLVQGDTLFFVTDLEQFLDPVSDNGWYYIFPEGVEGVCQYSLSTIVYDTDASLHPAFSCYSTGGEGCQIGVGEIDAKTAQAAVNACIGITTGIVEDHLDATLPQRKKKPILSTAGEKCFISATYFNQLFNYTQGVNEKSCFDIPLSRNANSKWEFDSDYFVSPGTSVQGGFYPVENSTDSTVLNADPQQTPVAAARTKRSADGPTFFGPYLLENDPTEGFPRISTLCKGPGWANGYDCTGNFADGDETMVFIRDIYPAATSCTLGWDCSFEDAPSNWQFFVSGSEKVTQDTSIASSRWTSSTYSSSGRNQQYCFESHAKFIQKPGQRFSIIGDDDIWVFIDNKLAIDLGGTHLAAPGYVDLDKFEGLSGALVNGSAYDIDIFYCDRRTTMTNLHISTNMYLLQGHSALMTTTTRSDSLLSQCICYTRSDIDGCASDPSDDDMDVHCCGDAIHKKNIVKAYSNNSFSIVNAGEHKLAIIMNNRSATAKTYAVMDMQGRVLSTGTINNEKVVSVPTAGTYVVKVGLGYKRVNVR